MPFLNNLRFTAHALQRMTERQITHDDVREVLKSGLETLRDPTAKPFPKYTMVCPVNNRLINVAAADNAGPGITIIITVF